MATAMALEHDPRIYFAAERTLLAWVRTGLATIGLGFVVARFGLFLRMIRSDVDAPSQLGSTLIGVCLVLLGSLAMAAAAWQQRSFCRTLAPSELPNRAAVRWPISFAAVVAATGLVLAIYLLARS
jgi:putative membrane protein